MGTAPSGSGRDASDRSSARRRDRISGVNQASSDKSSTSSRFGKRRHLSKSLTGFFSKLRPSQRPERGGTVRAPTDNAEDARPAYKAPSEPASGGSSKQQRSSSRKRHGLDGVAMEYWNTPSTPPCAVRSAGNRATTTRSITSLPDKSRTAPSPRSSLQASGANRSVVSIPSMPRRPLPAPITTPASSAAPDSDSNRGRDQVLSASFGPAELLLAKRELRRQRHNLKESGDFLGVTGVNPLTGEMDVITPPTSSEDAAGITTTTNTTTSATTTGTTTGAATTIATPSPSHRSSRSMSLNSSPAALSLARQAHAVGELARQPREQHSRLLRELRQEEKRCRRAERRKQAVREAIAMQGVKWRKEETGWSSVAEPRLSPIPQSHSQSHSHSHSQSVSASSAAGLRPGVPAEGKIGGGAVGAFPQQRDSFLAMAAVARLMESRCRRRSQGQMLLTELTPGQPRLGQTPHPVGNLNGAGMRPLREVTVTFSAAPPIPHRASSQQWDANLLLSAQPERDLGGLMVIPVNIRGLSEGCRAQHVRSGRVVELKNPDHGPKPCRKPGNRKSTNAGSLVAFPSRSAVETASGRDPAFPSACTRTITITGFEHNRSPLLIDARPFDGILDGSLDVPQTRRVPAPTTLSRPTSRLFSTAVPSRSCSERLAFPGKAQRSVWRNSSSPGLPMRSGSSGRVRKEKQSRLPVPDGEMQPLLPEPRAELDNDTTSSSTSQGKEAGAKAEASLLPVEQMRKRKDRPVQNYHRQQQQMQKQDQEQEQEPEPEPEPEQQQQPEWEMRKTMRPHTSHAFHETAKTTGGRRSSPTSTRTFTYFLAAQPQLPSSIAGAREGDEADTIARGAARTAFVHQQQQDGPPHHQWTRPRLITVTRSGPPKPISGSGRGKDLHGGTGAAKAGAKTGTAMVGTGQGQGQGQGQEQGQGKRTKAPKDKNPEKDAAQGDGLLDRKGPQSKHNNSRDKDKTRAKGKKEKGAGPGGATTTSLADKAGPGPSMERWLRTTVSTLERVVGAYWQVVSPVFDGESELRKRVDGGRATRADAVVCVLAAVFLLLAASAGAWAVRGGVWLVRLLGGLAGLIRAVAGF